jgi:PAS domain-containing protein
VAEAVSAVSLFPALDAAFEAIGRGLICLDGQFNVLHASPAVDRLLGAGATASLVGQPCAEVLDPPALCDSLRQALERGERCDGWGAELRRPRHQPHDALATDARGRPGRRLLSRAAPSVLRSGA